ncbi:septum formation family protein [Flexivirga oryzae]|uniref:Septum formation-related domain-containing protein n=1 Tax=Flexivirga oryzae TaxID=1794944 RepID=A0A839N306_9MICO|nr:septum formation family protein [Flexivirga oryzae]MBB2890323.1 hypothetical protein [Flexivirga oryzae]
MALTNHRLTRPILTVATISTVCLGLAACGGGNDSPTVAAPPSTSNTSTAPTTSQTSSSSSAPSTPASETSGSSSAASGDTVAAHFEPGQCYDDTVNWQVTPCNQSHKLEVTAVVKTTKDADDMVKRGVLRTWTCNNAIAAYVGSPTAGFSRILGQPVPSIIDPNSDKEIVCAAAVAKPDDSGYEQITYKLKNRIKDKGYVDYRICTSDRPSKSDSPKIVPCSDPHKAETIGGYVIGKADGKYPGGKAVDQSALKHCVPLAKTYLGTVRGDVIAAANSTGEAGWVKGTTMTACFVEATKGTFLKPLKGMKDKPLSKFQ